MGTPLSFCDISVRYGQTPAPRKTPAEQTGWDPKQLLSDYMRKVRVQGEENEKRAEEDALMAMIDAMNASEKDKKAGKTDLASANALADAGRAIAAQHTEVLEDGTRLVEWVDPTQTLTVQAMLACLGDRFVFEQADKVQENEDKAQEAREQEAEEERLEVTETRETSGPNDIEGR